MTSNVIPFPTPCYVSCAGCGKRLRAEWIDPQDRDRAEVWCEPCGRDHPTVAAVFDEYPDCTMVMSRSGEECLDDLHDIPFLGAGGWAGSLSASRSAKLYEVARLLGETPKDFCNAAIDERIERERSRCARCGVRVELNTHLKCPYGHECELDDGCPF